MQDEGAQSEDATLLLPLGPVEYEAETAPLRGMGSRMTNKESECVELVRPTTPGMGELSSSSLSRLVVETRGRTVVGGDPVLRVGDEASVSGCMRSEPVARISGKGRGVGAVGRAAESRVPGIPRRCTPAASASL